MTREQIEKAAKETLVNEPVEIQATKVGAFQLGFVCGAQWRINSVWHNSDEEPEERKEILVEYRFMTSDGEIEVRREVVESLDDLSDIYCDVLNWAYLEDLLPERKEETKVEEFNVMEENKLNLKPFDIQKAREGKPVCTRDGRKARIICFDKGGEQPIVALIEKNEEESIDTFFNNGHSLSKTNKVSGDLMMLPEKKEGKLPLVGIYKNI